MDFNRDRRKGVGYALVAACLFGISTPLSKTLLPHTGPVLLAGLLYLGSGIGLGLFWLIGRASGRLVSREARLGRPELPWLAAVVFFAPPLAFSLVTRIDLAVAT